MRTSFSFIKGEVARIPRSAGASVFALDFIRRHVAFLGVCPQILGVCPGLPGVCPGVCPRGCVGVCPLELAFHGSALASMAIS